MLSGQITRTQLKRSLYSLMLTLLLASISTANSNNDIPAFELEEIGNKILVAFKPAPHRFVDSNITIIEGEESLLVVDAWDNLANARKLIASIRERSAKPVKYLVNTHWHSDHTLANAVFREAWPGIQFIGHQSLLETMPSRTRQQLDEKIERYSKAIGDAEKRLPADENPALLKGKIDRAKKDLLELQALPVITPDITFDERHELNFEGRKVVLLHFGKAHTDGDTVVYLPDEKLLIAGDLFDELPYAGHGYPSAWLAYLRELQQLDMENIIPGHGALQTNKATLATIIGLLDDALQKAEKAHQQGMDEEAFMNGLNLGKIRSRFGQLDDLGERVFKQFIPEFYQVAFKEKTGKHL